MKTMKKSRTKVDLLSSPKSSSKPEDKFDAMKVRKRYSGTKLVSSSDNEESSYEPPSPSSFSDNIFARMNSKIIGQIQL